MWLIVKIYVNYTIGRIAGSLPPHIDFKGEPARTKSKGEIIEGRQVNWFNLITSYCGIDVSCDTLDTCYQKADHTLEHIKVPTMKKDTGSYLNLPAMPTTL